MIKKSRLQLILVLLFLCISAAYAQTQRNNELQKICGGPYTDLSDASRQAASKYISNWIGAFRTLGEQGLKDSKRLQEMHQKEFLPLLLPFEKGTPSEQKVFIAGQEVFKTMLYVSDNLANDGPWNDKKRNLLIRQPGKPASVEKLAQGVGELFVEFFQIVNPKAVEEHMKSLDESARTEMINFSFGK
ncbi:MAG TPA: hypothetical protein VG733_12730 [Chthoniobacteraceae bacterium]|nr:hypothetical protein [Chthoniobacteraceae bacterium]